MAQLFAGTSGFSYPSWKPDFYPADLPSRLFLQYYATRLNSVEANYTFRRPLTQSIVDNWVAATPEGFRFGCKAHMRLTHINKLMDAAELTKDFLKTLQPIKDAGRLGPVLYQFPEAFRLDFELLAQYLLLLPRDIRFAFEFRNGTWLNEAVFRLLQKHNVALCLTETDKFQIPKIHTPTFHYCRLRDGEYNEAARAEIAAKVAGLVKSGADVYAYFKHEDDPRGALYAEELQKAVASIL